MIETDDLDKWNDWVEAANKEAELEVTQLGEGEQGTRQKLPQKKTSYITKVENKQVRLKTQE
jgi:3-phenylpropionate/cinnamic acid dioxygenase small subunit